MKKIKFFTLACAALTISSAMFAESASDIMKKSCNLDVPETSQCVLLMDLIDKNGNVTEHRIINQFGNKKNGITSTVFDFRAPAGIKDTRILQAEKVSKEDDKYIFLPSLKTTRRIATAERTKSFVGSEYTYNDMTIRKFEDDEHTMLEENVTMNIGGKNENLWKIKSVPVANKNVEYAYVIQFIDKDSYLPLRVEYYDKNNKLLKHRVIEKHQYLTGETGKKYLMRMSNLIVNDVTGRQTRVMVDKVSFDKPLSDRYFTQNWLNTGK